MGPVHRKLVRTPRASGNWPSLGTTPASTVGDAGCHPTSTASSRGEPCRRAASGCRGKLSPRDCTHRQRLQADGKAHGVGKGGKAPSRDTSCQENTPAADPDLGKTSHSEDAIPGVKHLPPPMRFAFCHQTASRCQSQVVLTQWACPVQVARPLTAIPPETSTGASRTGSSHTPHSTSWHFCWGGEEIPTPALPVVGLWPKTPLKKAGIRMLPPMSEPTPMTEQAAARTLPSPPAREKTQQKTPQAYSANHPTKQEHLTVAASLCTQMV